MKCSLFAVTAAIAVSAVAGQTNLRQNGDRKLDEGSKSGKRLEELEAAFPCLGPFVNSTVVDQYTEKDNTALVSRGLITKISGPSPIFDTILRTEFGQRISKSEIKQICATKCEEVVEDCTIFQVLEVINSEDAIRFNCWFYSEHSISAQFPVENPYPSKGDGGLIAVKNRASVFHKGEDLVLPEFQGCDVPVGDAASTAITCRLGLYIYEEFGEWPFPREHCEPVLANLTSDFEDYIFPSVGCTFRDLGFKPANMLACLGCLEKSKVTCRSAEVCDEDNIITKKCTDTEVFTSSGKVNTCRTCGDVCPQEATCVAKLQTALLCTAGANPVYTPESKVGGCMNADIVGFQAYLGDEGNGDYKCLDKTVMRNTKAVPDWV